MTRVGICCAFVFALLFSTAGFARSFEEACAAIPAAPLATVSALPIEVHDEILDGNMHRMTVETTGAASLHQRATVGTTLATRVWEASYGLSLIRDPATGRVCYRPQINVVVGYEPLRIAVTHPFHSGTCARAAIIEHEREHVNIYARYLSIASDSIVEALQARIADKVRYAASLDAANAQMRQLLTIHVHPTVREEMAKGQALHDQFDSMDESVLLNACGGEIRRGLSREVLARQ